MKFRSSEWFGRTDIMGSAHRSWMKNQGYPHDEFDGRPVIGICNTWSELTPCNGHFRELADFVKRGVYEAGGFPLEFPVMSLGEPLMRPTTMLFRNLVSMDVEETIRANPIDGVVLLTGCDKTVPSLIMGAASCDIPTIVLSGGPMLNGNFCGCEIGSGTHMFRFEEDLKAGRMTRAQLVASEASMSRSAGHCNTMGTASTMNCLVEALGLSLPGNGAIPAVDSRRRTLAQITGRRAVDIVKKDLRISQILTRSAFENAIKVTGALGGSTNAVIHLLAIAGRIGVELTLDDWDRLGKQIPCLVDLMPSGRFLMEQFYYAGGLPALLSIMMDQLDGSALTINGKSIRENNEGAECFNAEVIRPLHNPVAKYGGIAVLKGNLCPDGAVIKPSAASPRLMNHVGRAVVFNSIEDFYSRVDDPELDVDADSVLVLQNCGPKGYPGMPETGNMPIPRKLLQQGVKDMVRISDSRMSGTAYGTVVLHIAPEAAVGGPLALVRNGDVIALDVERRILELRVPELELKRRRDSWRPPEPRMQRGWHKLYHDHVLQADRGVDLDFLVGCSGAAVPRESH